VRITSAVPGQDAEVVVKRLRKVDAPPPPQSVMSCRVSKKLQLGALTTSSVMRSLEIRDHLANNIGL
jgi:hypothetical protein